MIALNHLLPPVILLLVFSFPSPAFAIEFELVSRCPNCSNFLTIVGFSPLDYHECVDIDSLRSSVLLCLLTPESRAEILGNRGVTCQFCVTDPIDVSSGHDLSTHLSHPDPVPLHSHSLTTLDLVLRHMFRCATRSKLFNTGSPSTDFGSSNSSPRCGKPLL
ncbi:unnamed protein product, partial [Mesorhabditis belari]|uniref:Uncharacterized protein n=1 Tax=Mesorhabditis belari TaxID=2138241 RepID=A0AAF3J275_9BILA